MSPLGDALVILGAAGIVIPVFARFRITPVIGFILVGLLVGPYGLGGLVADNRWLSYFSISDPAALKPFAEFGIVMLLFSVGLELSFGRLWGMRKQVFGLGAAELAACATLLGAGLLLTGEPWAGAVGLGCALALSSTALVLPIAGTATPVGRTALAMLLFEDLALVPILFLLGALGARGEAGEVGSLVRTLVEGAVVVAVLLIGGRFLLPRLFSQAARTKSPELFLSASLLVVIVSSLATAGAGLSPIVGALIAGLLIAETEYHNEVEGMTAPFKGLALGVFLITVGMEIDMRSIIADWPRLLGAIAGVIVAKALVTALLLRLGGARPGMAIETGILLGSPSETTLIVLATAATARLIDTETAQFWQIVTALGLTITPVLAAGGRRLARLMERRAGRAENVAVAGATDEAGPRAIVVGFGRVGRMVADLLRTHDRPFVAVDSDPDLIREALAAGYPALFGDANRPQILARLGIEDRATAVILTMDDPVGAQNLVRLLRRRHADLPIVVRARDAEHAARLYRAGATHAVPETLESSLQLAEAALVDLGVPMGFVIASIHQTRDDLRRMIMEQGNLATKPKLATSTMRDRRP